MEQKAIEGKKPTEEEILSVDIDPIYYLFMIMKNRLIPEEKAISYNWTTLFFKWLKVKIKSGQLIVIQIRGEVRTGKSTIGLVIKAMINQIIYELGKRGEPVDEFYTILSDQTEFVRFTMDEHTQMCIQIDEYNPMAEGGANASTENQIIQTNNNMFASEYVHRINCNPTQLTDSNAFIHLETIGSKDGVSRVRLKYCDNIGNEIRTLVINQVSKIIDKAIATGEDSTLAVLYDKLSEEMERRELFEPDATPTNTRENFTRAELMLSVEYGFKGHEKGQNLEMTMREYTKIIDE